MKWKPETKTKWKRSAFFLFDLTLVALMFFGSFFFFGKEIMSPLPEGKPVLYEKRDGYCPETFHVAIRDGFFGRKFCTLGIRSKRKLSKEDLYVEPFVCRGRRFGRIEITDDPFAASGSDGIWNLLFKIDFLEDEPASIFSRIDFAGMSPWALERESSCVVIRLNPAAREYVSRVAIPVCSGIARQDILCAEHDDPQTEAIRSERRFIVRLLLLCSAAFCIAATFFLYFSYVSRNLDGRTGIRAFGKHWSIFMVFVAAGFSACHIVHLLILVSESLFRAGSTWLSRLQEMYRPVNISMAAGIGIAVVAAVFLLLRRKRRGPDAHLLPWLPLLCIAALACLSMRNQFARHYFRERFREAVYHPEMAAEKAENAAEKGMEDNADAEPESDSFAAAGTETEP